MSPERPSRLVRIARLARIGRVLACLLACLLVGSVAAGEPKSGGGSGRTDPSDDAWMRAALENALAGHGYSFAEAAEGIGVAESTAREAAARLGVPTGRPPFDPSREVLEVLPWAPGRHPRLGFLDGAVDPLPDSKLTIHLPWPGASSDGASGDAGYVVFDLPEAIFCDLGLIYLAHTHIPTIWDERGLPAPRAAWRREPAGEGESARREIFVNEWRLPNGIEFGVRAEPRRRSLDYVYWLRNGTSEPLRELRTQACALLGRAPEFAAQSGENKIEMENACAARSSVGDRWVVTACEGSKPWQNPPCPCIHADPRFPDLAPGERAAVRGSVFFLEGTDDPRAEVERRRAKGSLFGSATAPARLPED